MSNTTQYTYGVIGASASSTTSAIDLVPVGAPAQVSGGDISVRARAGEPVGHACRARTRRSVTVITLGAVTVTPDEKSPHPASGTAKPTAATAVATRLPRPPAPAPSPRPISRRPILGPAAGCGSRYGAASPPEDREYPERGGWLWSSYALKALWPVRAWPMTRVCISGVPS